MELSVSIVSAFDVLARRGVYNLESLVEDDRLKCLPQAPETMQSLAERSVPFRRLA